jgi:hypothetical protein
LGQLRNAPLDVAVFEELPHTVFSIYTIISMSSHRAALTPPPNPAWHVGSIPYPPLTEFSL